MIEGISMPFIALVVSTLGMPGMAVVFWYVDQRQTSKLISNQKEQLAEVLKEVQQEREEWSKALRAERERAAREHRDLLDAYREDVRKVSRMYEDNVLLVKGYERAAGELLDTIRLNTQTTQMLVDYLKRQVPCYERIREAAK